MRCVLRLAVITFTVWGLILANTYQSASARTLIGRLENSECSQEERGKAIKNPVRLRITVLATGQVGGVELVKKRGWKCLREMGLVDKAITAVRAVKFQPKLVDGKPVDHVIIREYTFTPS